METGIRFKCGNITLDGQLNKSSETKAAVICHPHPLYGGNMDNPVVLTIAAVFQKKGVTTLRFNFRGTGSSSGMFDDGNGEQDDVRAALTCLQEQGYKDLWLAGYSFGARMNAAVIASGCEVKDHIMVSPPAGFMSFDEIESMPDTGLIVTGSEDDIAPANIIKTHIERWNISPVFKVIQHGDHFYSTSLNQLESILMEYINA